MAQKPSLSHNILSVNLVFGFELGNNNVSSTCKSPNCCTSSHIRFQGSFICPQTHFLQFLCVRYCLYDVHNLAQLRRWSQVLRPLYQQWVGIHDFHCLLFRFECNFNNNCHNFVHFSVAGVGKVDPNSPQAVPQKKEIHNHQRCFHHHKPPVMHCSFSCNFWMFYGVTELQYWFVSLDFGCPDALWCSAEPNTVLHEKALRVKISISVFGYVGEGRVSILLSFQFLLCAFVPPPIPRSENSSFRKVMVLALPVWPARYFLTARICFNFEHRPACKWAERCSGPFPQNKPAETRCLSHIDPLTLQRRLTGLTDTYEYSSRASRTDKFVRTRIQQWTPVKQEDKQTPAKNLRVACACTSTRDFQASSLPPTHFPPHVPQHNENRCSATDLITASAEITPVRGFVWLGGSVWATIVYSTQRSHDPWP